jgi:hypothetical protein
VEGVPESGDGANELGASADRNKSVSENLKNDNFGFKNKKNENFRLICGNDGAIFKSYKYINSNLLTPAHSLTMVTLLTRHFEGSLHGTRNRKCRKEGCQKDRTRFRAQL